MYRYIVTGKKINKQIHKYHGLWFMDYLEILYQYTMDIYIYMYIYICIYIYIYIYIWKFTNNKTIWGELSGEWWFWCGFWCGFPSMKVSQIDGWWCWFISWNIPSRNGWWLGVHQQQLWIPHIFHDIPKLSIDIQLLSIIIHYPDYGNSPTTTALEVGRPFSILALSHIFWLSDIWWSNSCARIIDLELGVSRHGGPKKNGWFIVGNTINNGW